MKYEDFLGCLLEPLNRRRLDLVKSTFSKLDRDGSGVLDAGDVAQTYNASKHPQVLSGRMTTEEAYAEFLDT